MKYTTLIFYFVAMTSFAQLSYVNTTTPHTNTTTLSGSLQIPGVSTNQVSLVNSNNIYIGDAFAVAFGKVNADLAWLLANGGSGGGSSNSNYILTIDGSGMDLTITNSLTLIDTNDPYLTINIITPNPIDPMTNATSGYYPTSTALATFTNQYGFTVQNLIPPTGTNESGPFSYGSGFSETIYTNSSLYMLLYGYTAVNFAGPYAFDSLGNLTNSSGAIAFTLGLPGACPNRNGPFYSAPQYGPTSFTNSCGYVLTLTQGTNYIYAVNGISVNDNPALYTNFDDAHLVFIATNRAVILTTNYNSAYTTLAGSGDANANSTYTGVNGVTWTNGNSFSLNYNSSDHNWYCKSNGFSQYKTTDTPSNPWSSAWVVTAGNAPAPVSFAGYYGITNYVTYWAMYLSNQWSFYSATNVTFNPAPIESVSVIGNVSNIFNVSAPAIPDTNTIYTADNGDHVTFAETNVGWWSIGPNGQIFGSSPQAYQLSFIISQPTPPGSYSVPNSCRSYLIAQIGGVKKYMVQGLSWMSTMSRLSQVNPTNNFISISSSGNATVYLLGNQVYYGAWSDSSAWSTNIPNDACSYSPMGLPATFMPALTQRTMTIP